MLRRLWRKNERLWLGGLAVVAALVAWELAADLHLLDPVFISSPSRVLATASEVVKDPTFFTEDVGTTLIEFFWGFLASVVVGIPLGIAMGRFRVLRDLLDPIVSIGYSTPRDALLPVLIIWFGLGLPAKAVIGFLSGVFPLIVNAQVGMRTLDPSWTRLARSYGAPDWMVFRKILLPAAVPHLLTGLRLAFGRTTTGIILGEMYVSTQGLGHRLMVAGTAIQMSEVFLVILIIAAFGLTGVSLIHQLEQRIQTGRVNA